MIVSVRAALLLIYASYSSITGVQILFALEVISQVVSPKKKSQHGCVKWALREHLTPPCSDFACGGLEDHHHINKKNGI